MIKSAKQEGLAGRVLSDSIAATRGWFLRAMRVGSQRRVAAVSWKNPQLDSHAEPRSARSWLLAAARAAVGCVWPVQYGYDAVRILMAGVLLTAAGLKTHQPATEPVIGTGLLDARWFLMATVEFELFFARILRGEEWFWQAAVARSPIAGPSAAGRERKTHTRAQAVRTRGLEESPARRFGGRVVNP